ncbi:MAG TPA: DEAD/DEAH box helicase, partial [Dehalococcoidia bacterium]|nr:DEAD/DEAH box helicase [Dehalococcoidia bacterium]
TAPNAAPQVTERELAAADALRGHLEISGPVSVAQLAAMTSLPAMLVDVGLARLEAEGFALRGSFDPSLAGDQWCARRLLMRIHGYTQQRLRREIEPVTAQDFMRFLLRWQRVAPGTQREGRAGVAATIAQLQGFELPVSAWESDILPRRVGGYRAALLDDLCLSGQVAWGRLRVRDTADEQQLSRSTAFPNRATPVTLFMRDDLPWLLQSVRGDAAPAEPRHGATHDVISALRRHGALFTGDIARLARRLPAEVETALWDGVARGILTADGYSSVRMLLAGRRASHSTAPPRGLRRGAALRAPSEGRWSLIHEPDPIADRDALVEAVAEQLLVRWGVVFRDVLVRETFSVAWRDMLWALRRMEARGTVRGGRFVNGFVGEQFALPEAVDDLRSVRRTPPTGETVRISAADPLNLVGVILPGGRIPALRTNTVTFRDGVAVDLDSNTRTSAHAWSAAG